MSWAKFIPFCPFSTSPSYIMNLLGFRVLGAFYNYVVCMRTWIPPRLTEVLESFNLIASNSAFSISSLVNHRDKQWSIKSFPQLKDELPFKIRLLPNLVILARLESEGSSAYIWRISRMAPHQMGRATLRNSCNANTGRFTLPSSDSLRSPFPW